MGKGRHLPKTPYSMFIVAIKSGNLLPIIKSTRVKICLVLIRPAVFATLL